MSTTPEGQRPDRPPPPDQPQPPAQPPPHGQPAPPTQAPPPQQAPPAAPGFAHPPSGAPPSGPPGWDPQPSYGAFQRYNPQPGYDPPPGYGPSPSPGYGPNAGYGSYQGYGPPPGYGPPTGPGYGQPFYPGPQDPRMALGLPPSGPGSLASRGQRLGARCLDWLFLLPINLAVLIPAFVHFVHSLTRFADQAQDQNGTFGDPSQIISAYVDLYAAFIIILVLDFVLEGACTTGWGRTPGKRIVGIGPVAVGPDGRALPGPLSTGRSWGRAASLWGLQAVISWIDGLWCLWDGRVQTLHDKVASTVVIVDDGRWDHRSD